jgi:hypothetical protein
MKNYDNARKLVEKETWINPISVLFNNSENDYFSTLSWRTLTMLPELLKFYLLMKRFMKHYKIFKNNCESMPQREAMKKDSYIEELFSKPASYLIKEKKIDRVAKNIISKFSYACTGVDMDKITALDFLNVSQGLVTPIYRFKFNKEKMEKTFQGNLLYDSITRVEKNENIYEVHTKSGKKYQTDNVILATPAAVTRQLLNLKTPLRTTCKLYVFHVDAKIKEKFSKKEMNVFSFESEIIFSALQDDGTHLIYTREENADLHQICTSYKVIGYHGWEKAMYVYGDAYLEQEYSEGLYVAGDHNGLGLEPTAISGIYAANQIINNKLST